VIKKKEAKFHELLLFVKGRWWPTNSGMIGRKKHIHQSKWSTRQLLCSGIPETNKKKTNLVIHGARVSGTRHDRVSVGTQKK